MTNSSVLLMTQSAQISDLSGLGYRDLLQHAYGLEAKVEIKQATIDQLKGIIIGNGYLIKLPIESRDDAMNVERLCKFRNRWFKKQWNLPEKLLYTPTVEKSFTWILLKYCHVPEGKDPELYYFAFLLPRVKEMWDSKFYSVRTAIRQMFVGECILSLSFLDHLKFSAKIYLHYREGHCIIYTSFYGL